MILKVSWWLDFYASLEKMDLIAWAGRSRVAIQLNLSCLEPFLKTNTNQKSLNSLFSSEPPFNDRENLEIIPSFAIGSFTMSVGHTNFYLNIHCILVFAIASIAIRTVSTPLNNINTIQIWNKRKPQKILVLVMKWNLIEHQVFHLI